MYIKFIGWISSLAGRREMHVTLKNPDQLKNILPFSLYGKENIIIIINNKPGSPTTVVSDEDQIILMPVISGG